MHLAVRKVIVRNPWSGRFVERDIAGLTSAELESYPLDEHVCDEIARAIAPCLPEEFLAAYVRRVGAIKAGLAIFGAHVIRGSLPAVPAR
jgi:hypothetical protein